MVDLCTRHVVHAWNAMMIKTVIYLNMAAIHCERWIKPHQNICIARFRHIHTTSAHSTHSHHHHHIHLGEQSTTWLILIWIFAKLLLKRFHPTKNQRNKICTISKQPKMEGKQNRRDQMCLPHAYLFHDIHAKRRNNNSNNHGNQRWKHPSLYHSYKIHIIV